MLRRHASCVEVVPVDSRRRILVSAVPVSDAAIVLCGGHSRRMQRDKASLPFGNQTMLERVVGVVSQVVDEVWVVAREGQVVSGDFQIARDAAEGLGPLAGLVTGLRAMAAERAFLTTCDVPLLQPTYVARMLELSRGHPIAVPVVNDRSMVTSAVYSREVLPVAEGLLEQRRLRPLFLVEAFDARIVSEAELREVDPDLASLRDCNTPEAYRDALHFAGHDAGGL
jgi:molybdopterin-guanine dinucleotide biosynthesis protein A